VQEVQGILQETTRETLHLLPEGPVTVPAVRDLPQVHG
jgi:hypothetical protein